MSESSSPAKIARSAMAAVQGGRREAWLAHFKDDARVEDPVGHLPPMLGREALAGFWDNAIAALSATTFDVIREWEAGNEAMLLANVTISTPTGANATYEGAFNYRVDANGKIVSLRAFWDLPAVGAALAG